MLRQLWHRLTCLHWWVPGGLTNFMTGRREYTCSNCGKRIERTHPPVNPWPPR